MSLDNIEVELLIITMFSVYNFSKAFIADTYNLTINDVDNVLTKYKDVDIDNSNYKNMFSVY